MKTENNASKIRAGKDRRKKGVSPVIGVILMVAATIVIAAVVLAMLGGFQAPATSKTVGVSASRVNATAVDFVVTGIQPAGTTINWINATLGGGAPDGNKGTPVNVGTSWTLTTADSPEHIVLTAYFADATSQVVFDAKV